MTIVLLLCLNLLTVLMGVLITQRYYSRLFARAIGDKKTPVKKVLTEPEFNIVDEVVKKAAEFVDKYPDNWSPWGVYKSNGAFTAFEFSNTKKGLKITPEGHLKYRNINAALKDDNDASTYIESFLPLSKEQQETVKGLFIKLQSQHLIRMLDGFDMKEEEAKLKTEKPKTVV